MKNPSPSHRTVSLTVNGDDYSASVASNRTLADFLRENLELTGTNLGCEQGVCGACTVLLDGRSVRSCLMLAAQAEDQSVTTIEGLSNQGEPLHLIQEAFSRFHALQCGYCTPGFILMALELLDESAPVTRDLVRERLSGNLCRCTGYQNIISAVMSLVENEA